MNVESIMTRDPACCTPDTTLSEVARMMADCDCGQIPVLESSSSRRPVGVVTDRDIAVRAVAKGKNPVEMTAREVMSSPAVTVTPNMTIEECCQTLEENQLRRVPVVDAQGDCCGMVAQADIAQNATERQTAEVVRTVSQPMQA